MLNKKSSFAYSTNLGKCFAGNSLDLLKKLEDESVDLFMTSPPFALLRKNTETKIKMSMLIG